MTITLYVNWEDKEIYQTDEELVRAYLDYHGGGADYFNEYLNENYSADTLFYATEKKKEKILKAYNISVLEDAKDWAINYDMIRTIEI